MKQKSPKTHRNNGIAAGITNFSIPVESVNKKTEKNDDD